MPRVTVILNAASGHHDTQQAAADIRAGFEDAGCDCWLVVAKGPQAVERAARIAIAEARRWRPAVAAASSGGVVAMAGIAAAGAAADITPAGATAAAPAQDDGRPVVAAAGGDGTINLVAALALEADVAFGLIPLGTFNYLARNLGIPLVPRAAATALATGVLQGLHVGRVNGHLFLNNASFGLYRKLLEEREGFKQRFGRYKLVAVVAAVATLLRHRKDYTLRLDVDGRPVAIHTPMLFFGLNSLQFENLGMDAARCTQAGKMAVISLQPTGFWTMMGLAMRGVLHRLHDSPDLRTYCASEAQVMLHGRRHMRVAVDGESFDCALPLRIEVLRDALQVVVPRDPVERR